MRLVTDTDMNISRSCDDKRKGFSRRRKLAIDQMTSWMFSAGDAEAM